MITPSEIRSQLKSWDTWRNKVSKTKFLIFIIVLFFVCAGMELEATAGPPAIPPPPLGTSSELTSGTVTSARSWSPKTLSDQFSGASAEVVNEAVSTANFDGDTSHAASQDALENYFMLGDADLDGLPDVLDTDAVDAIGEISSGLKSGSDGTVITGTAGTDTYTAVWNADGDLVDGYDPATKADVSEIAAVAAKVLYETGASFNPQHVYDNASHHAVELDSYTALSTTITRLYVVCDVDPTTEPVVTFYFKAAGVGYSSPTLIRSVALASGVANVTSGFDTASVPAGRKIFAVITNDPDNAIKLMSIKVQGAI